MDGEGVALGETAGSAAEVSGAGARQVEMVATGAEQGRGRSGEDWSVAGGSVAGTEDESSWGAMVSSVRGNWWVTSSRGRGRPV